MDLTAEQVLPTTTQEPCQSSNPPSRSSAKTSGSRDNHDINGSSNDTAWVGLPKPPIPDTQKHQRSSNPLRRSSAKPSNGISSTGNSHIASNLASSTFEGLPAYQATVNTQASQQSSYKPSSSLPHSNNRFSLLRPISNDGSTSTQSDSTAEQDSAMATGSETDDLEVPLSVEDTFQTVKTKKQRAKDKVTERKPVSLPNEVEVVCEHFEREVFAHPQKRSKIPKVCQSCKSCPSRCKYAYWSEKLNKLVHVRPVPAMMRPIGKVIRSCHHIQNGKPCLQSCTFAHGPELQMWDLERKGGGKLNLVSKLHILL